MNSNEPCVCGSAKPFNECCQRFLTFKAKPKTPRQLVRSRYAAYALGGHKEYLIKTWHPHTARSISIADLDTPDHHWKGLEIMASEQKGDAAVVEFKVTYAEDDGPDQVHHERSLFRRFNGEWLYVEGEILE